MNGPCVEWYRLCLAILGAFTAMFMMLLGYNLKWRNQQIELIKRTEKLEKKNGKEQAQLVQQETFILTQQKQINELKKEVEELKNKKKGTNQNE